MNEPSPLKLYSVLPIDRTSALVRKNQPPAHDTMLLAIREPLDVGKKIDLLPNVIDVASHLGLIDVLENGNVRLTQLGKEIVDGNVQRVKERMRMIIDKIEPFRTITKVLRRKKRIIVEEFMEIAERFYPYNTTKAVKTILEWGAFAELFRMIPDDEYVFIT